MAQYNDSRGAAITSYTLGVMFDYQGRFGAAINAKQTSLKTFQDLKDKTTLMAEMEGGYGESLILAGRGEEAKAPLDDAVSLSRELKNDGVLSQNLVFQGDLPYYTGDLKSARAFYEQAYAAANRSKEPERILLAKVSLAKIAAREAPSQQVISNLHQLTQQADELGLQNVSVSCALAIGDAMIRNHDNVHAQQELERALLRADKIGLKPLSAQAHYLLGNALRASGNQTEAQQNYRSVVQLLDGMRQEAGSDKHSPALGFQDHVRGSVPLVASEQGIRWSATTNLISSGFMSSLARQAQPISVRRMTLIWLVSSEGAEKPVNVLA